MLTSTRFGIVKNLGLIATITSIVLMIMALYGMVYTSHLMDNFEAFKDEVRTHASFNKNDFEDRHLSEKELLIDVKNVNELRALYASLEFDLFRQDAKLKEIPRVFVNSLPKDLKKINRLEEKKQLFVQVLLPMILAENEKILEDRRRLFEIRALMLQGHTLSEPEQDWLATLIQRYKLKELSMDELIQRVDFIPPSLALGQAILETGWGVSFAALEKNSPFGYTISDRVKFYESLQKSVEEYILNLNTHNAYRKMRVRRSDLRQQDKPICSFQLADTLHHYSELGALYISRVKNVMKVHSLGEFDSAQLAVMSQRS